MILSSIPSPNISFIELGPFKIHFYALCILTGIILAIWIANRRLVRWGYQSGLALDIALWTVPIGVVGARIFHVLTHSGDYFYPGADVTAVFRIWEGGIAIYGGLIGGALGAWIGSKRAGIKFWDFTDAVAPGVLLAQAAGRWGNYFNQELFGQPTTLPWGLEIDSSNPAFPNGLPAETLFHPTFLYESTWSLIGVVVLLALDKRFDLRNGAMFGSYLIYYSIGRLVTENLRIDPSDIILGLRTNVWSAILGIVAGAAIVYIQRTRYQAQRPVFTKNALDSTPE
ncbi:MAG: prolipoprotein diacylglyceryl transferase [Rhodoluna sp.]|nr:prolipoprotein diacylglyceryl transferase [Rhodoluna sp.]